MSAAGFGVPNGGGGFAFKVDPEGNVKIGNDASDDLQITGSLHLSGSASVTGTLQLNENLFLLEDGKIGIGDSEPNYKLSVGGSMEIGQYIYHKGDNNTFINFTDNRIRLNAGGTNFIDCEDPGSAPHKVKINNGGNNIDFVIKDNSNDVYFTADASTSRIGIGTDTPSTTLEVAGPVTISGSSSDTYLMIQSDADCGIRLVADVNAGSGENDNPYIDFFQDGGAPTNRAFAQASIGLIGDAGQKFSDSLANAFYLMAATSTNFDNAFQIATRRNTDDQKASRITIEHTQGFVGIHTSTPSHTLEVSGAMKAITNITAPTTQDLGSGTSSTLSIGSSLMFLDADSITGQDLGLGMDVHTLNIPNGTTSGQRLTLVVEGNMGAGNSVGIMVAGNLAGASDMFMPNAKTSLNFVYYSTASISAWYQV